jgi:hypothetical protein
MRDGGSVTFGSFCGEPPTCARLEPAVCFKFSAPACPFAQPEHHRLFPSNGSPKCGCFRPQPSHFLLATSTAPTCPFAQPAHHRVFPSDGSPRLDACGNSSDHSLSLRRWLAGDSKFMQIGGPAGFRRRQLAEGTARPPSASSMASSPACHLHPAVLAFASGLGAGHVRFGPPCLGFGRIVASEIEVPNMLRIC